MGKFQSEASFFPHVWACFIDDPSETHLKDSLLCVALSYADPELGRVTVSAEGQTST